ncbi:MAG: SUF system NifU family Fe-S cluster assembly protein [Woeseiaceae bacterium]|nr:SUF system NifU family Fe-S cluster assembly protein [Woeseiaceae bacterium]
MSELLQSPEELRDLYRELILDHARRPRHFGKLDNATHFAEGINPLCGDKLKMYFSIDDGGQIKDARFEGSGCAISVASASLLTDTVIGMSADDALNFFEALVARLAIRPGEENRDANGIDLGKLTALEGVKEFPSRVKCATLAWHALHSAILRRDAPATTE